MSNTESSKKKNSFSFRIIKIALIDSFISEDIEINTEDLKYSVGATIGMSNLAPDINVEMSYTFYSADEKVFSITVSTEYKLSKPKFIVENDEIVERSCLAHLIQLSWNHLRGIQATLIKNTPLEGYYAPVISPSKILKDLTPSEFASE